MDQLEINFKRIKTYWLLELHFNNLMQINNSEAKMIKTQNLLNSKFNYQYHFYSESVATMVYSCLYVHPSFSSEDDMSGNTIYFYLNKMSKRCFRNYIDQIQ